MDQAKQLIQEIAQGWSSVHHQRELIRALEEIESLLRPLKREALQCELQYKLQLAEKIKELMETENMKKTPAEALAKELLISENYRIEGIKVDIESVQTIIWIRKYHLRINEIEMNKSDLWDNA